MKSAATATATIVTTPAGHLVTQLEGVEDRALYTFVFRIGRTTRACQQWHTSQETAEVGAQRVAADYAEGRKFTVLHVYPVSGTAVVREFGQTFLTITAP